MEREVVDVWQHLSRQRAADLNETDLPMSWDELDQDVLATLPVRRRCLYLWDGRIAPASDVISEVDQRSADAY